MTKISHPIRISEENARILKILKKRLKAKNIDGVILKLREYYNTTKDLTQRIEKLETENKMLREAQKQVQPVPAVPQAQVQEAPVEPEAPQPQFEHECEFYTLIDGKVHCSKDYDARGVIHVIPEEICLQCWTRIKKNMKDDEIEASQFPCLCRYESHGQWYCLLHPPRPRYLEHGLKTCVACAQRLSEERADQQGLRLTTQYFPSCGAKERQIGAERQLKTENPDCPFQGKWVSMLECLRVKCPLLKALKVRF